MYPNPQDVLPLPARPDIGQYRKRAKELVRACRSGEAGAFREWANVWTAALARRSGKTADAREHDRRSAQIAEFACDRLTRSDCALSESQFVIARAHGFQSWPRFVRHLRDLSDDRAGVSDFERSCDTIVRGDLVTLRQLLQQNPALVGARSTREHRATLLHYVSANGVENYRQKTPENILESARILLDAGAEVDAEANVYGGGATTLELVVTSTPPRQKGVQLALAELLLQRGARLKPGLVRACLANGCPEAAEHVAERGVALDLDEAAGIGRLDVLQRLWKGFNGSTDPRAVAALMMAAWYGQTGVIEYLLNEGVPPDARDRKAGNTALHAAAYAGHPDVVHLLVQRGADIDLADAVYGTPPLAWALHAWLAENRDHHTEAHRSIVRMLAAAGAQVKPEWIDDPRLRADTELWSLLTQQSSQ